MLYMRAQYGFRIFFRERGYLLKLVYRYNCFLFRFSK
jgi:hypothetical protein